MKRYCLVPLLFAAGVILADGSPAVPATAPAANAAEQVEASEAGRDNALLRKENLALRRQVVALRKCLDGNVSGNSASESAGTHAVANTSAPPDQPAESGLPEIQSARVDLETSNERLRKENQKLRRQVVALRSRIGNATAEDAVAKAKPGDAGADLELEVVDPDMELDEHWLSGSKRRHNSSCRYFKTGHGCLCTPTDGTPCRVCGG